MRFSEAYKVRSSLLVGCGPLLHRVRTWAEPSIRSLIRAPNLDSRQDHALSAAVLDPALHGNP